MIGMVLMIVDRSMPKERSEEGNLLCYISFSSEDRCSEIKRENGFPLGILVLDFASLSYGLYRISFGGLGLIESGRR